MANIETTIQKIAHDFVQEVVRALVGASIEEFVQLAGKGVRRPASAAAPSAPKALQGRPPKAKAEKVEKEEKAGRGKKTRNRRSSEEIAALQGKIVKYVYDSAKDFPKGISVSEIAKALREDIDDITRPIHQAVTENKIRKEGIKRLTRYFPV
jgi:ribosomal protein L12E/L44/L45/RPP1/RPP2